LRSLLSVSDIEPDLRRKRPHVPLRRSNPANGLDGLFH
jgi:hypothetical protein